MSISVALILHQPYSTAKLYQRDINRYPMFPFPVPFFASLCRPPFFRNPSSKSGKVHVMALFTFLIKYVHLCLRLCVPLSPFRLFCLPAHLNSIFDYSPFPLLSLLTLRRADGMLGGLKEGTVSLPSPNNQGKFRRTLKSLCSAAPPRYRRPLRHSLRPLLPHLVVVQDGREDARVRR